MPNKGTGHWSLLLVQIRLDQAKLMVSLECQFCLMKLDKAKLKGIKRNFISFALSSKLKLDQAKLTHRKTDQFCLIKQN